MFNQYYLEGDTTNVLCRVTMNQPSTGFIQKSNPVSRFIRFQRGSEVESTLFPVDPREIPRLEYYTTHYCEDRIHSYKESHKEEVIILQVCIFGNDYMLAEYVFKKDLETK